jgi:putative Mg2+ transporter-C (MgtC) family protein
MMETSAFQLNVADIAKADLTETALRLVLAMAFGMVLGIDREVRDKPAGMRSHMLVSLAAACLTLMTFSIVDASDVFGDTVRSDPLRLIEAVVAGVAFLGAGAIIQGRRGVTGITTGASMWVAGAIGVASGLGQYVLAGLTTGLAFVVLFFLGKLETYLKDRGHRDGADAEIDKPDRQPR